MKYIVTATETSQLSASIEADSKEEAMEKALEAYNAGEFEVTDSDLSGFEASASDEA